MLNTASRRVLLRFALVGALATVTALLLGSLGRWFWPFDLLTHFHVHWAAILLLCAVLLFALRERRSGAIATVAAGLAAIPIVGYLVPEGASHPQEAPVLRALSLNAWFRNSDPLRLVDYIETSAADVVVLQEVSESKARALSARLESYPHVYVEGAGETDVVLFSRWPITQAQVVQLAEGGVAALRADIAWHGETIVIVGVHLHWPIGSRSSARRNAELNGLAVFAQAQTGPVVLLGDFNVTPWSPHFKAFVQASRLRDCALGHGLDPTWPSQLLLLGIRIDHCFMSPHWRALDAHVGPRVGSDHRPIIVDLILTHASNQHGRAEDNKEEKPTSTTYRSAALDAVRQRDSRRWLA